MLSMVKGSASLVLSRAVLCFEVARGVVQCPACIEEWNTVLLRTIETRDSCFEFIRFSSA